MATVGAIRDALQGFLNNATGLIAYDVWREQLEGPCIVVRPVSSDFDQQFGTSTMTQYRFEARLFYPLSAGLGPAQDAVDQYLSPGGAYSVRAVLDADPTLGGVVAQAVALGWRDYASVRYPADAGPEWMSAVFDIDVWAE